MFAAIGTQYGAGNGSTTFGIPDLRGEFIRGVDRGRNVDTGRSIGSSQAAAFGQHNHAVDLSTSNKTLTGSIGAVSQSYRLDGSASGVFSKAGNRNARLYGNGGGEAQCGGFDIDASHDHTVTGNTDNAGSTSNSNETRPRNVAMMYIIKT